MYCALADILDRVDAGVLVQLTDDDNLGEVDENKVEAAIEGADATIDAYCGVRNTVPFDPVPAIVKTLSVDLSVFNLYSRRGGVPENVRKIRDDAIAFLRDVSRGAVSLGPAGPDQTPSGSHRPQSAGAERIFSRDKMRGW